MRKVEYEEIELAASNPNPEDAIALALHFLHDIARSVDRIAEASARVALATRRMGT